MANGVAPPPAPPAGPGGLQLQNSGELDEMQLIKFMQVPAL